MPVLGNTNFKINDVEITPVTKDYLIDVYPTLIGPFKQAGLWSWGHNGDGQLGDDTRTHRSSPVQTISGGTNWKQVACGFDHTAVIKTDGTLWLWGRNDFGQLGDSTRTHRSSPVQTALGGNNWKKIACGVNHTAAIKTDGTLWLWGRNSYGSLGNGTSANKSSPIQTISGGNNWKQIACGFDFTASIKADGSLWTWGRNSYGSLGDNSITDRNSPVQTVSGGTNWKQLVSGYGHIASTKTDGTLWTWGLNSRGQLGDNSISNKSSPVQTVSGGTNWNFIAAGGINTASIKTDGTLWLWGRNFNGQLGDNSVTHRSSPVQTISGGTNWKLVACGAYHAAAFKTDGSLWIWGQNINGQLGDNTITHRSSPVQTVSGGTNWKMVSCGQYYTACIRDDSADIFGNPL